ncbi:two pore domain potassium channel family protein [Marinilactibacillus kalidii]|uniref:two pore domain potassium channel family protein n=1 Tax=Marinilactibacillus kalidii TaxID=2820274 RepID=UPI001ABEDE0D|nr:two pore domain potassium channel family protein [Marinilactibacillus kalidii]
MNWIFYILGFGVIGLTIIDLVWTTLWVDGGAGPLSKRLAELIWRGFNRIGKYNNKFYDFIGPVTLVSTLFLWSFMIWAGFSLFFSGDPTSISNASSPDSPIVWYERIYFTGFTLFTLGVGDYSPKAGFWQIMTTLNSGVGILFLTLCASYIISVVDAVVQKRSLAMSITSLGNKSTEVIDNIWNGEDFHNIDLVLVDISSKISHLTQQHHAYPLLHFYHSSKPKESASVAIAILDETLTILKSGLAEENKTNFLLIQSTKSSITTYLESLTEAFVSPSDTPPPIPNTDSLIEKNVPLISAEDFEKLFADQEKRRKQLMGAIKIDHHKWPDQ